jgi:hypothetical protein
VRIIRADALLKAKNGPDKDWKYNMEEENTTGQAQKAKGPAKRTPTIEIKLSAGDYIKFSELCRLEGKTRTDMARAAILRYLDQSAQEQADEARDRLATILEAMHVERKKDTERLAKLASRTLIDLGTLQQVFYKRASEKDRDDIWDEARKNALERLRKKRKGGDPEATELMKDALSS